MLFAHLRRIRYGLLRNRQLRMFVRTRRRCRGGMRVVATVVAVVGGTAVKSANRPFHTYNIILLLLLLLVLLLLLLLSTLL